VQRRKKFFKFVNQYIIDPVNKFFLRRRLGEPLHVVIARSKKRKIALGKQLQRCLEELPKEDKVELEGDHDCREAVRWILTNRSERHMHEAINNPSAYLQQTKRFNSAFAQPVAAPLGASIGLETASSYVVMDVRATSHSRRMYTKPPEGEPPSMPNPEDQSHTATDLDATGHAAALIRI